jgi:surface protein
MPNNAVTITANWTPDGAQLPSGTLGPGGAPWTFDPDTGVVTIGAGTTNTNIGLGGAHWMPESTMRSQVTNIVFTAPVTAGANLSNFFTLFPNLETIIGLHQLDTSNVTNMRFMFAGASSLTTLDLSGPKWDTSSVISMSGMFNGASSLTTLDLSGPKWDTSSVIDMSGMFQGTSSLRQITFGPDFVSRGANSIPAVSAANGGTWRNLSTGATLTSFNLWEHLRTSRANAETWVWNTSAPQPQQSMLTIANNPAGAPSPVGQVPVTGQQIHGAAVTISAGTRSGGFTFSHWTASPSVAFANANNPTTTFVMPSIPVTITAHWAPLAGNDVIPTPQQLSAPTDLSITNMTFSWGAVSNASGYRVYVGGQAVSDIITTTTFNVATLNLAAGTHSVQVRAIGTGNYADSALSDAINVVITGQQATPPATGESDTTNEEGSDTSAENRPQGPATTPRPTPAPTPTPAPATTTTPISAQQGAETLPAAESAPTSASTRWTPGLIAPEVAPVFDDIITSSGWYVEYVNIVTSAGVFQGTGDGQFSPDGVMTRAMFAQVLANLSGADLSAFDGLSPSFSDISSTDAWYFAAVEWAASLGIVTGIGDDLFAPDTPISREQMAVMLHRFMLIMGIELPVGEITEFIDQDNISPWAAEAVVAMQAAGIITGRPDGSFDPQATATRAEVAAIFARLLSIIES